MSIIFYESNDNSNRSIAKFIDGSRPFQPLRYGSSSGHFIDRCRFAVGTTYTIFKEGELDQNSVVKEYLTTARDGKRYKIVSQYLDFAEFQARGRKPL